MPDPTVAAPPVVGVSVKTLHAIGVRIENAIACALAERGMTVADVAHRRGLSRSNLSKIIHGTASTTLGDYRVALAEELGVDRDWLDAALAQ